MSNLPTTQGYRLTICFQKKDWPSLNFFMWEGGCYTVKGGRTLHLSSPGFHSSNSLFCFRFLFFEKFITLYSILPPFSVKIILFEIRYMFDFATLNLSAVNWHLFAETVTGSVLLYINLFLINVPLLYPLKTSENRFF